MYCNYCGTNNEDGSKFCQKCGKLLGDNEPQKQEIPSLDARKTGILMGVLNLILFIMFFLPWFSLSSKLYTFLSFLGMGEIGSKLNLSPSKAISIVDHISKIQTEFMGVEVPGEINYVYLLLIIPIFSVISLVLYIINKKKLFVLFSRIGSVATAALTIIIIMGIKSNEEISYLITLQYGLYITLICSVILAVISLFFIKNDFYTQKGILNFNSDNSSKLLLATQKELANKNKAQIGYLVFAGIIALGLIIEIATKSTISWFEALILILFSIIAFKKIRFQYREGVKEILDDIFDKASGIIKSLNISSQIMNSLDKYVFGIIVAQALLIFVYFGGGFSAIRDLINCVLMYTLFVGIVMLFCKKDYMSACYGIIGYSFVKLLSVLKCIFGYRYIPLNSGIGFLVYWTLGTYLYLFFANQKVESSETTAGNSLEC